jgi:hypothetical protein
MYWILVVLVGMAVGLASPAAAQVPYNDELTQRQIVTETEGWAWARTQRDEIADLNLRCDPSGKTGLEPHTDAGWNDDCRKIGAKFIINVLTDPRWRDQIKQHGVHIQGARINNNLDLIDAEIGAELEIKASRIDGNLDLTGTHFSRSLSLHGTRIRGNFAAPRLRADSSLYLRDAAWVEGDVGLRGAKVGGDMEINDSTFDKTVDGTSLSVGGNLYAGEKAFFKRNVRLINAKVNGQMYLNDSTFQGEAQLINAKVGGRMRLDGSTFERALDGTSLSVDGNLYAGATEKLDFKGDMQLYKGAIFKGDVLLKAIKVGGRMYLDGSTFEGTLDCESITVGGFLLARKARFLKLANFNWAHLDGTFDLRGSVANNIELSAAVVAQDLVLGGINSRIPRGSLQWLCTGKGVSWSRSWPLGHRGDCPGGDKKVPLPRLDLRNTHVGGLQDSADAWPPNLDLENFKYDRLGGYGGYGEADIRRRPPEQWQDWLERDRTFSTQPYAQLANVLLTAGHRDTAEAIQSAGWERERSIACEQGRLLTCWWPTALRGVSGFSIGLYTVLFLIVVLTAAGTLVLQFVPNARRHGWLWCFGASLHRLLPSIGLDQSFKDFFENSIPTSADEVRNLNQWQVVFFYFIGIAGWVLGPLLLVAIGAFIAKG